MAASSNAQASSKGKLTCPRCHRNDHVNRYHDIFLRNVAARGPREDVFLRDPFIIDAIYFNRRDDPYLGYIGTQTDFCFFKVVNDQTVYVCEQKH
jgi:hypothetical protein